MRKMIRMTRARKGPRQTYFVCISMRAGEDFVSRVIPASSPQDASTAYKEQVGIEPKEILGPFFKKRAQVLENTRTLKFTNKTKRAIYNDWVVNAFILKEPENQAYLVFISRVDNKPLPKPKGTITVPVSDLRFI
jgi:hypothetical protein